MIAGSLEIELMANLAKLKKSLDDAHKMVGGFADNVKKAAGVAMAALAAVGVGLSVSSFMGWVKGAIDAANAAGDMAKRMGVATKEVAGLSLAFQFSDVQGDAMVTTMGKLSQAIAGGNKALDAMGIKTKTAGGQLRDTKDVLYESADVISSLADGAAKNALVLELFGKQGLALIPMLNDGSEGMRKMAEMAERLGLVVSQETADSAAEFNDTLDLIKLSSQGVAQGIAAQVLPTLQTLTGQFFETLTEGDNLRKVSDFLAASMKILYSVGVAVVQIFSTVGKTLGAAAAQVAALLSGDFKGAKAVGTSWVQDMKADWSGAAKTITAVWSNTGDATVAAMAESAKKGREIRMKSDADKAAADKAAADALAAQIEKIKALDKAVVESRKDAMEDIALAVKLGKKTEDDAIAETLAAEQKAIVERIALVERERAARQAAGQMTLKDAAQLDARIEEIKRAGVDAERKAASELALLDKARLDALDARALAEEKAAQSARMGVIEQQRQNQVLGLEYANAALGAAGSTAELARQVAELERSWAYEAAAQLERQAVTQSGIDLTGRTSEALRQQAAALRQMADLKFDAAGTKGAVDTLRDLDAYLDPSKPKDFGAALKDAFGEAGNALAQLANAFQDYTQQQTEWDKQKKALDADKSVGPEARAKREMDLAKKSAQIQIGSYASMAGAAKGFFKEHSKGYKAMEAAEQAFRAFEMALAVESMVKQLFGIGAVSAAEMAAQKASNDAAYENLIQQLAMDQVEGQSKATVAVATQATGDPYSAFVRMAAMVAAMAALGFAVGGGGGGGESSGYTGIKAGGTGTVLGMENEASKSIGNAIELLADNSSIELTISQRMLSELTKVREGIAGLAGDISKDFFIRGMAGGSFGDAFLDSGVGFLPNQDVGSIIKDGINGFGFNLIFANGAQAMWRELDPAFKSSISSVLGNIVDTVISAADLLGLNDDGLIDRMLSIIPTLGDTSTYAMNGMGGMVGGGLLSFKDKSGKEIQEELEAVFSSVGDQMVAQALPALARYQRVGEGMFETLIRVTTGIERAEYALERFGIQAISYTEIIRTGGDVATEIVRQSVMAMEPLGSGVAQILDVFTGELDDLLGLYSQLMTARGLLRDIGADDMALGTGQVRGAGGIDSLLSGLEAFRDGFFSEQEQVAAAWARMSEQFDILGVSMPRTIEDFRALALAQDQSTMEGAQLFGGLMALASGFKDVADRATDLEAAAQEAARAQAEAAEQAAQVQIAAAEKAAEAQRKAAEDAARAAEEAARKIADSWTKLWRAADNVAADFMSADDLRLFRAGSLAEQFKNIGIGVDAGVLLRATQQDFLALFESIDRTSVAGREQAAGLLGLWGAFKQLLPVTEDTTAAAEAARKAVVQQAEAAFQALQASIAAQKEVLQKAYDEQVKIVQDRTQAAVAAQQDRVSAITSIFSALDAAIGSTRVETLELTRARRQASQAYLAQALAAGRAGQSLTNFAGLETALQTVAQPSEDLYTTFDQYAIDQAKTASDIFNLRQISQGQMTTAEMTLQAIQKAGDAQLNALKAQYDSDVAALDEQLEFWRRQLDAVKGVSGNVLSVRDAVNAMSKAVTDALAALEIAGVVDGSHATGLSYVPRDGYVAELHRGERVLTAQQNTAYSNGARPSGDDGAVVAELRALRYEVSSLREQQAEEAATADEKFAVMAEALDDAVTGRNPFQVVSA